MTSARLLTASVTDKGAEVPAASATPIGRTYRFGDGMFKSASDERGDRDDEGENLIRHTPRAHAQPDSQTDQHVAKDPARKGRNRIERNLAARDPDHRLSDRAVAHGLHADQPY